MLDPLVGVMGIPGPAGIGPFYRCIALCRSRRQTVLGRLWPFAILVALGAGHLLYVAHTLHPVYQSANERPHHALWHALINALANHPDWGTKYAAEYGWGDPLPENVAKKYLLQHPPENPDAVYLTSDREYLRIGVTETYKRAAFFHFVANDPSFVAETFLIYNPQKCINVFWGYFASLDYLRNHIWTAFIVVLLLVGMLLEPLGRLQFGKATLIVSLGFFVSTMPIVLTVPSGPVMGDQCFMLVVSAISLTVLAISYLLDSTTLHVGRQQLIWRGDRSPYRATSL